MPKTPKYKYNTYIEVLKEEGFTWCSPMSRTVPKLNGSCTRIINLKGQAGIGVKRKISHKDGSLTLETNIGFIRFWKL